MIITGRRKRGRSTTSKESKNFCSIWGNFFYNNNEYTFFMCGTNKAKKKVSLSKEILLSNFFLLPSSFILPTKWLLLYCWKIQQIYIRLIFTSSNVIILSVLFLFSCFIRLHHFFSILLFLFLSFLCCTQSKVYTIMKVFFLFLFSLSPFYTSFFNT